MQKGMIGVLIGIGGIIFFILLFSGTSFYLSNRPTPTPSTKPKLATTSPSPNTGQFPDIKLTPAPSPSTNSAILELESTDSAALEQ